MIDLKAYIHIYENGGISEIGWIRSDENFADFLTKRGLCKVMTNLMDTGRLQLDVLH